MAFIHALKFGWNWKMDWGDGGQLQHYKSNIITPHTLRKVSSSIPERQRSVPRIRDVWVPKLFASPNHFIILYILSVEDLFQNGDHLRRVEHYGSKTHHKLEDMVESKWRVVVLVNIHRWAKFLHSTIWCCAFKSSRKGRSIWVSKLNHRWHMAISWEEVLCTWHLRFDGVTIRLNNQWKS